MISQTIQESSCGQSNKHTHTHTHTLTDATKNNPSHYAITARGVCVCQHNPSKMFLKWLNSVSENADVDELFAVYDSVLRDIADHVAPPQNIRRRSGHLAPWFDGRCRQARRECRRLERRYRRTGTDDDRHRWVFFPEPVPAVQNCETGILARPAVSTWTLICTSLAISVFVVRS